MVYMHFPSNLTEEEVMLQAKYQKLKKKKKAVVALKAPKQEPEKPTLPRGGAQAQARDAREHARKLLKSGAIRAIATPTVKHNQLSFKRPRAARERKLSGPGSLDKGITYQPFSAVQDSPTDKSPPRVNSLYDSFVVARDKEERVELQKPKNTGNTVFVTGHKITEDYLKKHLGTHGNIVNISMEVEKHRGFVTYDRPESAQRAISELNGVKIAGIQLEVSMARRQPQLDKLNEGSASSWSTLASSHSQKGGPHKDNRTMVTYDDAFLF